MIKLFKITDRYENIVEWCFAFDHNEALKIVKKAHNITNNRKKFTVKDVTEEHKKDDGFDYLVKRSFIGIPQQSVFMLNGCMSSMVMHYEQKNRSGIHWWSESVPGSKELWV